MALSNSASGGGAGQFVSFFAGYFGKRADETTEGAVARKRGGTGENCEDIIYEIRYDTLEGLIDNAWIDDESQFGNQLVLQIKDGEDVITAKTKMRGNSYKTLVQSLGGLDANEPVSLNFSTKGEDVSFWVKQGGVNIKREFTKANPAGAPEVKQVTKQGVKKWDYEAYDDFLYGVAEKFCSNFEGAPVKEEAPTAQTEDEPF